MLSSTYGDRKAAPKGCAQFRHTAVTGNRVSLRRNRMAEVVIAGLTAAIPMPRVCSRHPDHPGADEGIGQAAGVMSHSAEMGLAFSRSQPIYLQTVVGYGTFLAHAATARPTSSRASLGATGRSGSPAWPAATGHTVRRRTRSYSPVASVCSSAEASRIVTIPTAGDPSRWRPAFSRRGHRSATSWCCAMDSPSPYSAAMVSCGAATR